MVNLYKPRNSKQNENEIKREHYTDIEGTVIEHVLKIKTKKFRFDLYWYKDTTEDTNIKRDFIYLSIPKKYNLAYRNQILDISLKEIGNNKFEYLYVDKSIINEYYLNKGFVEINSIWYRKKLN